MIILRIVKIFVSEFNFNVLKKVTEMLGVRVKFEVYLFEVLVIRIVYGCVI